MSVSASKYSPITDEVKRIIIGKIPGYNDKISPKEGINYTSRLLNNLTNVKLRPTGYTINLITGISDSLLATLNVFGADYSIGDSGLYKFGPGEKIGSLSSVSELRENFNIKQTSQSAVKSWGEMLNGEFQGFVNGSDLQEINELNILVTNDSTVTEVFSNSFEKSAVEKLLDSVGSRVSNVRKITGASTVDSGLGRQLLAGSTGNDTGALSVLATKALGIQTALPREWTKSDYSQTLQLIVKLISPSGHPDDIKQYIEAPLKMLMIAASPVSYDGVSSGYPMLWEIEADGLMDMKLAGISAMTISRGGTDTQFNRFNQPLNVEVRMTLEPLVNGFGTLIDTDNEKYKNFLISNPGQLSKSLSTGKDPAYVSIKL